MTALPPVSVIDLFPGERERLLTLLSGLSDAEWAAPTACPGWSVHDLALHLLADDVSRLSRGRDGFRGEADAGAAAGVDASHWEQFVTVINRYNEAWVQATRRISPRVLCAFLALTGADTSRYFALLNLHILGEPVSWAGPDPAPV